MKGLTIKEILFFIAFAIIIAIGIGLTYKNKSKSLSSSTNTNSSMSSYKNSNSTLNNSKNNSAAFSNKAVKYQNFSMPEPFAATAPFEVTPVAWMQMMNNMMNNMTMTQMMHQMAAMPMQMMQQGTLPNPHAMLPNHSANSAQQPMSPEDYKKWYELQLKHQQSTK